MLAIVSADAWAQAQNQAISEYLIETQRHKEGRIRAEQKILKQIEKEIKRANQCSADGSISYLRIDDKVKVNAEIRNHSCGASSGKYQVTVSSRNNTGDIKTHDYREAWSRDDNSPVINTHYYHLNTDAELMSVQVTANAAEFCTCLTDEILEEIMQEDGVQHR